MPILAAGLSHREAPVELRERLAIPRSALEETLDRLREFVPAGVILSTCNRTEIYASVGHLESGQRSLFRFLAETSGLEEADLRPHLRTHWQEAAARHLFRVAAGLDSMIVGEGQVLGQVRESYDLALSRGPVGPELARLFDRALVVGKRARTETAIARSAVSVSQAAIERARQVLGRLDGATVLIVGAGKMGELAAKLLRARAGGRLLLMNRTRDRADALVDRYGGEALALSELDAALECSDVVITSTASEQYLITPTRLRPLLERRGSRPLVIVDIAVPRNVDPAVSSLPFVHLSNVDDLQGVCEANLDSRRQEGDKVEAIVEEEIATYIRWWQSREVVPTIAALVQRAEEIRQEELTRALGRMAALSDRERSLVSALTVAITNKILHTPITRLKESAAELDGKHYLHAVRELFDLPAAEVAAES